MTMSSGSVLSARNTRELIIRGGNFSATPVGAYKVELAGRQDPRVAGLDTLVREGQVPGRE